MNGRIYKLEIESNHQVRDMKEEVVKTYLANYGGNGSDEAYKLLSFEDVGWCKILQL